MNTPIKIAEDLRERHEHLLAVREGRPTFTYCPATFNFEAHLIERLSRSEESERELRKEIRTLRHTVNPNTLERLIRDGKIPVGDGVLPWVSKDSPLGLDRLLSNVEVGNDVLAEGVAEEIASALLLAKKRNRK